MPKLKRNTLHVKKKIIKKLLINYIISGQAEVKQAELKAQAMEFEGNAEIEQLEKSQKAELEHKKVILFFL